MCQASLNYTLPVFAREAMLVLMALPIPACGRDAPDTSESPVDERRRDHFIFANTD